MIIYTIKIILFIICILTFINFINIIVREKEYNKAKKRIINTLSFNGMVIVGLYITEYIDMVM